MKGVLLPDHIPVNNYILRASGLSELLFTSVGALEEELETVDLPDRTVASGGHTKPIEFEVKQPLHHRVQVAVMQRWYADSQEPVAPNYKKTCTLILRSISNLVTATYILIGVFPSKMATSELSMDNEGEEHEITWTMKADQVQAI